MVVDCGGGTVDITVHEIQDNRGRLKELYKATGGPYGSVGGFSRSYIKLMPHSFSVHISLVCWPVDLAWKSPCMSYYLLHRLPNLNDKIFPTNSLILCGLTSSSKILNLRKFNFSTFLHICTVSEHILKRLFRVE